VSKGHFSGEPGTQTVGGKGRTYKVRNVEREGYLSSTGRQRDRWRAMDRKKVMGSSVVRKGEITGKKSADFIKQLDRYQLDRYRRDHRRSR
jgi:hypothetical protein